jgi:hypothetical protein
MKLVTEAKKFALEEIRDLEDAIVWNEAAVKSFTNGGPDKSADAESLAGKFGLEGADREAFLAPWKGCSQGSRAGAA